MIDAKSRVFDGSVAMRRFLLAAVMFGAAAGAQAADMPDFLRGSLGSAPPMWQGFYVGGQAAYGSIASNPPSSFNSDLQSTFMAPAGTTYDWAALGQAHSADVGYGGFAGYNSQWGDVVVGIEGNYLHTGFSSLTSAAEYNYASNPYVATNSSALISLTDFGSARLRAGYVVGCFLPYLYGGFGFGSETVQRSISASPAPLAVYAPDFGDTKTKLVYGYSAGAGVDMTLVGGLFLRAEYEYLRVTSTIESNVNSARLGLGYKF
jgi:outer membrane immunogenic protein